MASQWIARPDISLHGTKGEEQLSQGGQHSCRTEWKEDAAMGLKALRWAWQCIGELTASPHAGEGSIRKERVESEQRHSTKGHG